MAEHFNNLSPAETERLAYLIEELAEAQQIACKILRHGYRSHNPDDKEAGNNRRQLEREVGDVMSALGRLYQVDDLSIHNVQRHIGVARAKSEKWMHHQDTGVMEDDR